MTADPNCSVNPTYTYTRYPCDYDDPRPAIDTKGLPVTVNLQTPVKGEVVNRQRESILSIEGELGLNPSGTYTTVRDRLDMMELLIGSGGSGGSPLTIKDEGVTVETQVTSMNFIGVGVNAVKTGTGAVDITVTGSGGYSLYVQEVGNITIDGQTSFTLAFQPSTSNAVSMFIDGVSQTYGVDFSVVGQTVSYLNSAMIPLETGVDVVVFKYFRNIGGLLNIGAVIFDTNLDNINIRSDRVLQSPIDNTKAGITNLGSDTSSSTVGATGNYSSILGGDQNIVQSDYAQIVGGFYNRIVGVYCSNAFIGGGNSNTLTGSNSGVLVGGMSNSVSGDYSVLVGGQSNAINSSSYAGIFSGNSNIVESNYSVVLAGKSQTIQTSRNSIIVGGLSNNILGNSNYSSGPNANASSNFIGCGNLNNINATNANNSTTLGINNSIIGGLNNNIGSEDVAYSTVWTVTQAGKNNFIGGGNGNSITFSFDGSVLGGKENHIERISAIPGDTSQSYNSSIVGGNRNKIQACYQCAIVTGDSNTITQGTNCVITTGYGNSITAYSYTSAIFAGYNNLITNANYTSILSGQNNLINIGDNNTIVAGINNQIIKRRNFNTNYSCIVGAGETNYIFDSRDVGIFSGQNNTVEKSQYSGIFSGYGNAIGSLDITKNNGAYSCFIGAGINNLIDTNLNNCQYVFIGAGQNNIVSNDCTASAIVAGSNNKINYDYGSFISGDQNLLGDYKRIIQISACSILGHSNEVAYYGDSATVSGAFGVFLPFAATQCSVFGFQNVIEGGAHNFIAGANNSLWVLSSINNKENFIVGGNNSVIGGNNTISGSNNFATGNNIKAFGNYSYTKNSDQTTDAAYCFNVNGDAQSGSLILQGQTADGYAVYLKSSDNHRGLRLDDGQTYEINSRALITSTTTTATTESRARFVNELLLHQTDGYAVLDDNVATLATAMGTGWGINYAIQNDQVIGSGSAASIGVVSGTFASFESANVVKLNVYDNFRLPTRYQAVQLTITGSGSNSGTFQVSNLDKRTITYVNSAAVYPDYSSISWSLLFLPQFNTVGYSTSYALTNDNAVIVSGLTAMKPSSIGRYLQISNCANPSSNGKYKIVDFISETIVAIENKNILSDGYVGVPDLNNGSIVWTELECRLDVSVPSYPSDVRDRRAIATLSWRELSNKTQMILSTDYNDTSLINSPHKKLTYGRANSFVIYPNETDTFGNGLSATNYLRLIIRKSLGAPTISGVSGSWTYTGDVTLLDGFLYAIYRSTATFATTLNIVTSGVSPATISSYDSTTGKATLTGLSPSSFTSSSVGRFIDIYSVTGATPTGSYLITDYIGSSSVKAYIPNAVAGNTFQWRERKIITITVS